MIRIWAKWLDGETRFRPPKRHYIEISIGGHLGSESGFRLPGLAPRRRVGIVHMPHIDGLAARGNKFHNVFGSTVSVRRVGFPF